MIERAAVAADKRAARVDADAEFKVCGRYCRLRAELVAARTALKRTEASANSAAARINKALTQLKA